MLGKERKKIKDVDSFTILDYIKTSIEILMNMKMDEEGGDNNNMKKSKEKRKLKDNEMSMTNLVSDTESMRSLDEPPKDYE